MKLHKIKDLVGKDVSGMRVDVRTRDKNGKLIYPKRIAGYHPVIVMLKKVEIKYQQISKRDPKKYPWLYWYWDGTHTNGYDCGYSGVANHHEDYYLMEV